MNLGQVPVKPSDKKGPNVDAMQKGREAAKAKRALLPELSPRQKFVLSNVRQAAKACKLLAEMLQNGQEVSPEAAEAANTLSSEYVKATM